MKTEIMRLANRLVENLMFCEDEAFVDSVLERVNDGTTFDDDEIFQEE